MSLFLPIYMPSGITLRDSNSPMFAPVRREALAVFHAEFKRLVAEVAETAATEPGCHAMWRARDAVAFVAQKDDRGGEQSFSAYRNRLQEERVLVGLAGQHRTLLAWRGADPVGGIVLYNERITGITGDGVLEFVSHIGPFMVEPRENAEVMDYLLETPVSATNDAGERIMVQLTSFQHESEDPGNRWRLDTPSASIWAAHLSGADTTFETLDGVLVRSTTQRQR